MLRFGTIILTIGAAMFAAGAVFPFLVGRAIPPIGYNILQIGGIGFIILGIILRMIGRKVAGRPAA